MMAGWHYMLTLVGVYAQLSGIFSQNCTTGSGQCLTVCDLGNYINTTNNVCVQCELGFYQDQNNATSCKSCGNGRITLRKGSPSYLYCVEPCSAGRYHKGIINTVACEECPVGQYQNTPGQLSCLVCPSGRTTYLTGSALCYDICNVGSFFNTTLVSCQYCPPGQYQPDPGRAECFTCPQGFVSTTGSTQCKVFCSAGQRIDNGTSQCVPCEIGTYQPETSQTSCISCGSPENWVTNRIGSTSISDCSFFCPSGYNKVGINSCESCPIGTFKDNAIDRFGSCQQCPPDSTTNGTRTTSIAFCNIYLCSPGTFWNLNQLRCQPCERGTYQPNSGLTSCIPCESSKTTNTTGAIYANQCIFFCQRGYSHNSSTDMCDPCPVGFYQDVVDQMFCKTCGFAHTTLYQASTSINDCIEICVSGTQYTSTGRCEPCLRGTYRTAGIGTLACQNCPNGFTTIGTGTPLISGCNIAACYQGTYRTINNICEACPLGTYQPDWYQESCSSCGPATNWFTEQVGSVTKDQCKFFCPSGYMVGSNNTCDMCPKDYYKDNTINVFSLCVKCPNNTFTASPGSTSINNCSIAECPAGYQRNTTLSGCQPCGVGFYQPSVNQNVCVSCPPNYSTRGLASDSSSDCELYCPSGQVLQNNTCSSCERGFYKDNTISPFMMCTRCPLNYVTPSSGSTSITNCNVRDCPAGTRRNQNDTGCIDCELGFYQPNPYKTSCIQCQPGYSTSTTRSTSITQCNRYCPPGTGMISNTSQCNSCPIGFYSETGFSTVCNKCPDGFITENLGSTSVIDCNIVACEAGSYRDVTTNTCQLCPIGEYQDSKYQTSCKPCRTPGLTVLYKTNHTGSTSVSECIYFCPSGYELHQDGQCYICPVGQYKDNNINIRSICTVCPDGKVTPGEGAISQSQCTIRDCPAGYFASLIVDRCIPCGFGTYQPNKNQASCINCPTGTSTKRTGSTSFSECLLYCQSGFEIVPNVTACQECQQGYYKDNSMGIYSSCIHCPENFTTNRIAAVSSAACNIRICPLGSYINQINQCTLCPKGMYLDQPFQSSCIPCPFGQTTNSSGSFNIMDCYYVLCPPGEQYLNGACQPCEIGFYKVGLNADRCQPCSAGVITLSRGSSLPTDCSIPECLAGQYLVSYDSILECRPCPFGTYQDEIWQRYCKRCQTGYITLNTNSISLDSCVAECLEGQVRSNKTGLCVPCPIGTYWTMGLNPKCVPCSDGLLTPAAGSITVADCLISPCQKGYMYIIHRQQCEICPRGTYQPEDGKLTCNYCPADRFYTSQEGSTDVTECRSPCLVGQGFNQNTQQCFDCPVGTYQPIPFSFTCIGCPSGRKYTNSTGSIQESDCLSYCGSSSRNECSVNATCTDDSSVPDGYTCVCKMFYTAKKSSIDLKPGRVCIHECDADFCMNNAVCSKTDSGPICSCNERYKGKRCQERLAAEDVMDDKSKWIIAVVVTFVVFILIVIAFIVWFCFRDGFQPCRKTLSTSQYMESHAIVRDNRNYRIPGQKILYAVPKKTALINKQAGNIIFRNGTTMKTEPEIMYDIPRFQRL